MTFKNQKWETRIDTLGDPAETAFEAWAEHNHHPVVRYGLNRPPLDMRMLDVPIRYTPDYLTNFGLVEVQGCGKDGLFKFKHEKLDALLMWHTAMTNVSVWLYNQPQDEDYLLSLAQVLQVCKDPTTGYRHDGLFDGHKRYAHFDTQTAYRLSLQLRTDE